MKNRQGRTFMKFGTGYSYWGRQWNCNYIATAHKVADIGFDVLEIGASHLHDMSDDEIAALKAVGVERGLSFSTNTGPAKEHDFASTNESVRRNGVDYYLELLVNMKKLGSPVLVGALYSFWPTDFVNTDKKVAWDLSIPCLQELAKSAEALDIEIALEVLNRNETYILTDCKEAVN